MQVSLVGCGAATSRSRTPAATGGSGDDRCLYPSSRARRIGLAEDAEAVERTDQFAEWDSAGKLDTVHLAAFDIVRPLENAVRDPFRRKERLQVARIGGLETGWNRETAEVERYPEEVLIDDECVEIFVEELGRDVAFQTPIFLEAQVSRVGAEGP